MSTPYRKPIGFPSRGHVGGNPYPNPPSPLLASAPDGSFSSVPVAAPSEVPENPPTVFSMPPPPCPAAPAVAPFPPGAPAPSGGEAEKVGLWCVAKPTVPADALQEGMDYACGEIKPQGSCYDPDSVVLTLPTPSTATGRIPRGRGAAATLKGLPCLSTPTQICAQLKPEGGDC